MGSRGGGARAARRPAGPPDERAALDIALRFLATRPRSRAEVVRRLDRAGADEATLAATLERLTQLGYLDDAAFARWWIDQRDRNAPRGRRLMSAELRRHGVSGEDVAAGLEAARGSRRGEEQPEPQATDDERADAALRGHLRGRPMPADPRALQRLGMYLVRRGFDPDTARAALRRAEEDPAGER